MNRRRLKLSYGEMGVVAVILGALALFSMPLLVQSREASRRSSCANNLKRIGISMKMYANENNGRFPPLSPIPGNWMIDARKVYPRYVSDLQIFICPSSPFARSDVFHLRRNIEHREEDADSPHPDCVSSLFYIYTGFTIGSDEQAYALFNASYNKVGALYRGDDIQLDIPVWDDREPGPAVTGQSNIPVVWDRMFVDERDISHRPLGGNVLFMDGHVEFLSYSPDGDTNSFPLTWLSARTFGSVLPRLSRDCDELW